MTRRFSTLAAALSLCLCVLASLLWLRSYHRADFLLIHHNIHVSVVSENANLRWTWVRYRREVGETSVELDVLGGTTSGAIAEHAMWALGHSDDPLFYSQNSTHTWVESGRGDLRGTRMIPDPPLSREMEPAWDYEYNSLNTPDWLIVLLTAVLPLWWLAKRLRFRRAHPGQCRSCGYDLRASQDRCPECGTPIPMKTTA